MIHQKDIVLKFTSHDVKSRKLRVALGFESFTRIFKRTCGIIIGRICFTGRNQKDGKYWLDDMKYDRGMYTFLANYENK